MLPAVTDGDICNLSFQSPPPGGVLRLNNSEDTVYQFVGCKQEWRHTQVPSHTCAQSTESHTLLGSERWDWRAGERRDRSRGYSFSSARFNFNALICEIMAADCNIVISRRIKRRNWERRANSALLRANRQTQGREKVAQRGGGRAMGKVEAERREEGSAVRWQPIVAGYKYSRDDRVHEGMERREDRAGW